MTTLLTLDIASVIFLILAGIIALAIISIPVIIMYFVHRWLTKKGYKFIGLTLILLLSIWTTYSIYTTIYPRDSFYFDEFKDVTLREVPKSAEVLRKSSSYPDFHGDYFSISLLKLSQQEYIDLNNELSKDKRLIANGELIASSKFDETMGNYKKDQIKYKFIRQIPGEDDHYLFIGFLNDRQTIIVYKSVI